MIYTNNSFYDFNTIGVPLAVAEVGNFTLARRKCFVYNPTLSMQVQKLEDELGVKLFNRNTKPIGLTPIGSKNLTKLKQ